MAHAFKKTARRLQEHWGVTYSTALRACTDTMENDELRAKVMEVKAGGKNLNDALFEVCVDTWEFD